MDVCRVCLTTENIMIPFDESFVKNYNTLTNLNVEICDELPQSTCQNCLQNVINYMEFREKSITSEATLRKILNDLKLEGKIPDKESEPLELANNDAITLLNEIKHEEFDNENFDGTIVNHKDDFIDADDKEDIRPARRALKRKKKTTIKNKKSHLLPQTQKEIKEEKCNELLCGLCKASFEDLEALNEHLEKHIKDKKCEICGVRTFSWAQLLGHRLNHVPVKQKRCHICYKRFVSNSYLESHYMKVHFGENPRLLCNFCHSAYDSPVKLRKHIWALHSGKKYICDYCSKCFSCKTNLVSHMLSHMKRKGFVCNLCGESFTYSSGLKDHSIRRHSSTKVYCNVCKRPFVSKYDLDRHKCAVKPVLCPICGIYCNQLKRHLKTHSSVPQYKCGRCPAAYRSRGGLRVHLDQHDGNKTQRCEYCPAKFYSPSTLTKHRRIHTGEKPYVCKVCSKAFTGNNNLKVHMKVHGEYLVNKKDAAVQL